LFFEVLDFKEAKINHTFFVDEIIMPKGKKILQRFVKWLREKAGFLGKL